MLENKERLVIEDNSKEVANKPLESIDRKTFVPTEVKTWLRRVEEAQMPTVKDDSGNLILTPSDTSENKIQKTLPVTKNRFVKLLTNSVDNASRWLGTFILRLIKMNGGKVKFKEI